MKKLLVIVAAFAVGGALGWIAAERKAPKHQRPIPVTVDAETEIIVTDQNNVQLIALVPHHWYYEGRSGVVRSRPDDKPTWRVNVNGVVMTCTQKD